MSRQESRRDKVESYLRNEFAPTDVREAFRLFANHAERLEEWVDRLHDLAEYTDLCGLSEVVDAMLHMDSEERRELILFAREQVEKRVAHAAKMRGKQRGLALARFEHEDEIRRVARLD